MKFLLIITSIILLASTKENCKKNKNNADIPAPACYKGKLEVKGGCMNYTISIVAGNFDTSLVAGSWTDESTGKSYTSVFALGSRCTFPETINAGDEFYFEIDNTSVQNCVVCMMYYPTPPKSYP